jgi:hypothetical protein
MKNKHFTIFILTMIFGMVMLNAVAVNATLIVINEDIVQDDQGTEASDDDQFWLRDQALFDNMSYYDQIYAIEAFTGPSGYYGEWRMARMSDIAELFNSPYEEGYTQTDLLEAFGNYYGRYDLLLYGPTATYCNAAAVVAHDPLLQTIADARSPGLGAWVVADSIAPPVPEPGTLILLGSGLAGLIFTKKKRKRRW